MSGFVENWLIISVIHAPFVCVVGQQQPAAPESGHRRAAAGRFRRAGSDHQHMEFTRGKAFQEVLTWPQELMLLDSLKGGELLGRAAVVENLLEEEIANCLPQVLFCGGLCSGHP